MYTFSPEDSIISKLAFMSFLVFSGSSFSRVGIPVFLPESYGMLGSDKIVESSVHTVDFHQLSILQGCCTVYPEVYDRLLKLSISFNLYILYSYI